MDWNLQHMSLRYCTATPEIANIRILFLLSCTATPEIANIRINDFRHCQGMLSGMKIKLNKHATSCCSFCLSSKQNLNFKGIILKSESGI